MSWLDSSPKRPLGKSKDVSHPGAKGGWGSTIPTSTRTYGSTKRRTAATVRNSSASRGLFTGGSKPTASSGGAIFSPMNEEDATAVSGDSSRLSPPLDSLGRGASLVSYGSETDLRVEAGSPEEEGSPPSVLPKNDGLRMSRAVKPSNTGVGGRSRRAPCRARGAAAEDALAVGPCGTKSSGREASGSRGEVSKRRGGGARKNRGGGSGVSTVALDSGGDAGEQTGSGSVGSTGTKLSPSKRRERSPGRKGGGRPERGVDRATLSRKPSSRLQSPLRSITNNSSSEGDRGCPRSKSKSGAVGGTADSPADSGSSSSGEEWQDNTNRSKRREKMVRCTRGSPRLDAQEDGGVQSPLPVQQTLEELEELEGSPLQAMTPSRSPPRATGESSFSLDSSLEGILVGDKRPRGNSRGKRTARGTEESAHRSSRSRHLSPMIPVTAGPSSHAFAVDEEGGDSEAATVDLLSPTVAGSISTNIAEASKLSPEAVMNSEKEPPNGNNADLLKDSESSTMQAPAPSARFFHIRRAASVGSFGSAPALSHSTSPRLALKRPSRREEDGVTITPALGKTTAARELEEWGESPPPRLSRSLSLSQTSAWSGSGGSGSGSGSGCGKVTRISSRRRSRASSTSSPLPVPELPVSLTAGSMGEKLSAQTTGVSGSRGSRSVGSGGGTRREQRRLRTSMIASLEGLGEQLLGDMGTAASRRAASSLRCHQMVSMGQAKPVRRERPTSLPNGLDLSNLGEVELADRGELDEACLGGDPGVGWVLRAPGAPLLGERSRSFASTFQGVTHGECMRPLTLVGGTDGAMTASGVPSSSSRIQRSSRRTEGPGGPDMDGGSRAGALEFSPTGMYVTSTSTPQSSYRTISAVRHRSSNLSSVARRMDRLEIRSDHVDTQATQAQKAIMGSPGEQQWDSSRTPSAIVTSSSSTSAGASVGELGTATSSATRKPAPETSPRERAPQAATPTRARSVVLPQLHLTPLEPSHERLSMGSVAACSPSACLRDYLSGSYRRPEEAPLEEERTPSTPSMRITASPVGIRRARSVTASASSPVVSGLFGSSRKGCVRTAGTSFPEGAELDLPRRVKDSRGNGSVGSGLVDSRVQSGRAVSPKPQKGLKSRPQPKTRSVSSEALVDTGGCSVAGLGDSGEDGPECGFLIRRKSISHVSSASPDWKNSLGHLANTTRSPAHFPRFGLGNNEGSSTGSLGSGGDAEMQSPVLGSQDRGARRRRNFSSPFPLASGDECGTPSAFLNGRGGRNAVGTTKLGSDNAGDTDPASVDSGEALLRGVSDSGVDEMGSSQRPADNSPSTAPAGPDVAAVVSAASESRPRRNSIESVGCTAGGTSSRPQFETPQPETKLRWGSRPQYGDWGISQPASARTLKRLAGRLMAFAGRAAGGRFSCGTPDSEQRLLTHASPGITPQRPFSALAATSTDTTPRGDSRLPRPSPGSSRSIHRQSFGFRNSLGTLSERGEFGMGMLTPKAEVGVSGDAEQVTEDDDAVEGLDVAEAGMMGEGAVSRGDEEPESGSSMRGLTLEVVDSIGRDGEGNYQGFPSLGGLMGDDQREAYRRRQKKAKMRRVSMSIKSRKSSGAVLGALSMAGGNVRYGPEVGLLEVAEAESPGLIAAAGNDHGRHRNHRRETTDGNLATGRERQKARGFVGAREGVISEREDEDEEENELDSSPVAAEHAPGGDAYSPSLLERRCGSGEANMRLVEEGKGVTASGRYSAEKALMGLDTPQFLS